MLRLLNQNIERKYNKKIYPIIENAIINFDVDDALDDLINQSQRDRFNTIIQWYQDTDTSIAIIYSMLKSKLNVIEHQTQEKINLFNRTWLAFIVISTLNLEEDVFKPYTDELSVLSGTFEWFKDEASGWYVLYYCTEKKEYFCGWFESEEEIIDIENTCYSLKINLNLWDNSNYVLELLEEITGESFEEGVVGGRLNKRQYLEILGLEIDATPDEIKTAYRRKCREYHPDVYKGEDATEIMSRINEAWNYLKDK